MSKFEAGQAVESKITKGKCGTILSAQDSEGNVVVRFDGQSKSVVAHASRFELWTVTPLPKPFESEYADQTFKTGDYLEVATRDHGTVRGAALSDWETFGYATYSLLTDEGELLELNSNWDIQKVIFRADIARGDLPTY